MPPEGTAIAHEEVAFESGGLALKGYLYVPPGKGPFPCVINNHGSRLRPGGADVSRPQAAALMMSWGYAFFFPHRRGYGDSPGEPLADAVPAPLGGSEHDEQLVERLEEECADVLATVAYARGRPEIDGARIALTGSSRGGIVSLLAAARDKNIRCAVNFSGGARQWGGHPKLKAVMLAAAHALEAPVFLAQAENDLNPKGHDRTRRRARARGQDRGKPHLSALGLERARGAPLRDQRCAGLGPRCARFPWPLPGLRRVRNQADTVSPATSFLHNSTALGALSP